MYLPLLLTAVAALAQLPSEAPASLSESATLMVMSAPDSAYVCYDGTQRREGVAQRRATFSCAEHEAESLESLLLPAVLCCNAQRCVPLFAEQQLEFAIESQQCDDERCTIVLSCAAAFFALRGAVVATLAAIVGVALSPLCMHCLRQLEEGRRHHHLTRFSPYETDRKSA